MSIRWIYIEIGVAYKCIEVNQWGLMTWCVFKCKSINDALAGTSGFLIGKMIGVARQWSTANSFSIYTTMWNIQGVILPLGGLPLLPPLKTTFAMRKYTCVFAVPDGLTWQSYEGGIVRRRGCKILSRSESLNDESDRISFFQVFRDLGMFRIKVAPLKCPIFPMQNSDTNQKMFYIKYFLWTVPVSDNEHSWRWENNAFWKIASITERMQ